MLAIPHKRTARAPVTYLTEPEVDALIAAPDTSTPIGRRDHAMLALTIQTGLRISELIALDCQDITLTTGAHVHTVGKGRKHRRTPLPHGRLEWREWDPRDGSATKRQAVEIVTDRVQFLATRTESELPARAGVGATDDIIFWSSDIERRLLRRRRSTRACEKPATLPASSLVVMRSDHTPTEDRLRRNGRTTPPAP